MATSAVPVVEDRVKLLAESITSEDSFEHIDACFDGEYEELKGRATADFLPLEKDEILLQEGDTVSIAEQTLDGTAFVVVNLRTGEKGKVPLEFVEIDGEELMETDLDAGVRPRPAVGIMRRPGVSKSKGSPFRRAYRLTSADRENLVASLPPNILMEGNGKTSLETVNENATGSARREGCKLPAMVPKDRHAQSVEVNTSPLEAAADRREGRAATVHALPEVPLEYKLVERHNIVSVSGADRDGRPVIVFSACRLPPSYQINHQRLLEYLLFTLGRYVEQDYTLVYFHHGFSSANKPSFSWLRQVYRELDRKYKKNLKKLFIVHPTNFIRIMMFLFKPLISYKFGRKLAYINRLAELRPVLYLDQIDIPEQVKKYDNGLTTSVRDVAHTDSRSVFHTPLSPGALAEVSSDLLSTKQFGVHLEVLKERSGDDIPEVLRSSVEFLEDHEYTGNETSAMAVISALKAHLVKTPYNKIGRFCCYYRLDVLGIFRRTPSNALVHRIKRLFDSGEKVDFVDFGDPHLAAVVMKLFLRELPEPLLTTAAYVHVKELRGKSEDLRLQKCRQIVDNLPPTNYKVLKYLISFICKVAEREEHNKMNPTNLAIVFGPNLIWSINEAASLSSLGEINMLTLLLINHFDVIFRQ